MRLTALALKWKVDVKAKSYFMPFYTFLMEFEGGTYISQVEAASPKAACLKWAKGLNAEVIPGFGQSSKVTLVEEMKAEKPVPIQNTFGVWCASALVRGRLVLATFVQTERP
jgi:hypothetical protein